MRHVQTSTLMPTPAPEHIAFLTGYAPKLNAVLNEARKPRAIVVIHLDSKTGDYRGVVTPAIRIDTPHLMAMGIPEAPALTMIQQMREFDPQHEALVLITEETPDTGFRYSFVKIELD